MWERQNYIKPKKVPHGRILRRQYSEAEFKKIRLMWQYRMHGLPPAEAHRRAVKDLALQDPEKDLVLHGPRLTRKKSTRQLSQRAEKIRRIVLENSPNLIIAVSGAACLSLGAAVASGTSESLNASIVAIDREEISMLMATLKNLRAEDRTLVFHDGSHEVVEALKHMSKIIGVNVNEL
ncbi:hypothetical protein MYX82_04480 [Acidobacteria bacterium AH-259-D05]|nr:hypothetical protein [Acidobacteria bacterium AH-259-D05]